MFRLLFPVFLILPVVSAAQGKLLFVGGGSEKDADWSWSNQPYTWAVSQAPNQKVAIVSYSESSDPAWLPDYFVSLGAAEAENFVIPDRQAANTPVLYNQLTAFDFVFFKGGDQSVYYTEYRDTELSRAVNDIYSRGGVVGGTSAGMAVLGDIIYSAEDESVYPDQALSGEAVALTTLRDDMFSFIPGTLTDTHFAERGRLPRLLVFLGESRERFGRDLLGVGVDDQTAFCIDADGHGTVYGTGAVTLASLQIYEGGVQQKPVGSAELTMLLHGQKYDLTTQAMITSYAEATAPEEALFPIQNDIYLTGSAAYTHNRHLWEMLLGEENLPVVVTGPDNNQTAAYLLAAQAAGRTVDHQLADAAQDPCLSVALRNRIREGALLLFTGNSAENLTDFFQYHPTGTVMKESIKAGLSKVVLTGSDAMVAGKIRVTNVRADDLNAYLGQLDYTDGLDLVPSSIVITDTYDPASSSYYENTTAAGIYALVNFRLARAIYLNERSWVRIYPREGKVNSYSGGDYSVMVLLNDDSRGDLADQPVNSSGNTRNQAGFDRITLMIIGERETKYGEFVSGSAEVSKAELVPPQSFTASVSGEAIALGWSSFGPVDGNFTLERESGGGSFSVLSTLSAEAREYRDENVEANVQYRYRLRQELDGQASCYAYAGEALVITSLADEPEGMRIYPNPVRDFLHIETAGQAEFRLVDLYGREVIGNRFNGYTELAVSSLKEGIYVLSVEETSRRTTRRIYVDPGNLK